MMKDLGVNESPEKIRQLFDACTRSSENTLSFKEVKVCLAIGYVLNLFDGKEVESVTKDTFSRPSLIETFDFAKAFDYAVYAFLEFDRDGSGEIEKEEIRQKFRSKGYKHGSNIKRMKSLATTRMEQLDVDGDGHVTFIEFLYGFSQWIRVDGDDDEGDSDDIDPSVDAGVSY